MLRAKNVDILNGPLLKTIIIYSIPIMIMGLVQQLFNAADIMVLNVMAGDNAVASVGATSAVSSLLVDTFLGIAIGTRIVLSRRLGEKNYEKARNVASTSIDVALMMGAAIAVLGNIFAPHILRLLNCPAECFDGALVYLRIYLLGAPVILLYNYSSAIVQVSGDTQRPLYYMLLAGVLNVVLNFVLCFVLSQKVAAVAIATVASQGVASALLIRRIFVMEGPCRLSFKTLRWSTTSFLNVMSNGLPQALYHAIYPVSNMMVYAQVNTFGAAAIAGNVAMGKSEQLLVTMATSSISGTVSAFMGQSLGAKNYDRVKKSFFTCLWMYTAMGLVLGVAATVFYRPLCSLFASTDEVTMSAAWARAIFVTAFQFIGCANTCFNRAINTFGYAKVAVIGTVFAIFGFRAIWMNFIYPLNPTLNMIFVVFTLSWMLSLIFNVVLFAWIYKYRFKPGKLKALR